MERVLFAMRAILFEGNFFRSIYLIAHGNIVLIFTDCADEGHEFALIFLCHRTVL